MDFFNTNNYKDETVWVKTGTHSYRVTVKSKSLDVERMINGLLIFIIGVFILLLVLAPIGGDVQAPVKPVISIEFILLLFLLLLGMIAYKCRRLVKIYLVKPDTVELRIIDKLGEVIHEQGLYLREDGQIESSIIFEFEIKDGQLTIDAYAHGSGLVDKIRDLDLELQDKLNMELRSRENNINHNSYKFLVRRERALRLPVNLSRISEAEIPITSSIKWNISKTPHALVAGGTGGGKTYFLFYLIYVFLSKGFKLYICDPKRSDLYMSREKLEEFKVATEYSVGGIAKNVRLVNEVMKDRYEQMDQKAALLGKDYSYYHFKPIFLIIDEFGSFLAACDRKVKTEVLDQLRQIIFQGRQAGVFVILATQKPDSDTIPTEIRDQLDFRAVLGNLSNDGYRMVFGSMDDMDYKTNEVGNGYLYFNSMDSSIPIRFRAPQIEELNEIFNLIETSQLEDNGDIARIRFD